MSLIQIEEIKDDKRIESKNNQHILRTRQRPVFPMSSANFLQTFC